MMDLDDGHNVGVVQIDPQGCKGWTATQTYWDTGTWTNRRVGEVSSAAASRFATALLLSSMARARPTWHAVLSGHGQLISRRPR